MRLGLPTRRPCCQQRRNFNGTVRHLLSLLSIYISLTDPSVSSLDFQSLCSLFLLLSIRLCPCRSLSFGSFYHRPHC